MQKKLSNKQLLPATHYPLLTNSGFTLIEILLYVSIVSIMLLVMSAFLFSILQARTKFQTISEVDQQGIQVMQMLTQAVCNAKKINIPAQGTTGTILSVDMADAGKTPAVFNSSGTNMQIKEGVGAVTPLTNTRIAVSGLSFANLSRVNTPGTIKFQFTLTYINPSVRNEYEYSKTFYGSASLR